MKISNPSTVNFDAHIKSAAFRAHTQMLAFTFWLYSASARVRHVQQSCREASVTVRACVQSLLSSNLRIGVIRSCGAAPFSSDSMLTTLQKAPKKRLGLAVSFPISHRPARSWTQLMANNYQGCFYMTAPGGLIAATGSGRPAVKRDASLLPLVLIFSLISSRLMGDS